MYLTRYIREYIFDWMEVFATDEFESWLNGLSNRDADAVGRVIALLEMSGLTLGYPHSSAINGATFALRELRVQSGGRPLRVFYAFDPRRDAVLIIGGDKTGKDRFYEEMIQLCEKLWKDYLKEQAAGLHGT